MTTAIVDYGSGNLRSAEKAFARALGENGGGGRVVVTSDPDEVAAADRIVLPRVGAFGDCRAGLFGLDGMVEALEEAVTAGGRPFLGICVGMQLMAERGLEHGVHEGLGWLPGSVEALEPGDPALKVPHMGWNGLSSVADHPVLAGLDNGGYVYFVHSYRFAPAKEEHMPGRERPWRPVRRRRRSRQFDRHAIPSREKPGIWIASHRELPRLAALRWTKFK